MLSKQTFALLVLTSFFLTNNHASAEIRLATFNVDATPAIGSPVAYAPVRKVLDPLSARGIVLTFDNQQPIVLCAVDWIGISNEAQTFWKDKLAAAAGTTSSRVTVHSLHQHDGARHDIAAEERLTQQGLGKKYMDNDFSAQVVENVAAEIQKQLANSKLVTHVGSGKAKVEKVASNRRLLGPDGKVSMMRWSKSKNETAIAAPEGVIDPFVHLVSFWNNERPLAVLSYYATHPQSYYGKGDVTCEFVGLARNQRDQEVPEALHVHFTGAGGNVAAGKYNDGTPERRPLMAERLRTGMETAWNQTKKQSIQETDCQWAAQRILLPLAEHLKEEKLKKIIADPKAKPKARFVAALRLSWWERSQADWNAEISCLRLGNIQLLHMPGELFVEYSLAAEKMRPHNFVCMAAYGEYGCSYIGTEIAYWQGGYETSPRASSVTPDTERMLLPAIEKLLEASEAKD